MTESDMTGSKLVFIDIDGTLADENHIVPESAKTACARAQANGHKLFICTGRSVPKIERNILDLGFDGVVSVAGAQANIGDKLLFQHLVSPEAIDAAMADRWPALLGYVNMDRINATLRDWRGYALVPDERLTSRPEVDFMNFNCPKRKP